MPGTLKNYYEILGVPRSATTDQIRTAYRKLLLKFHPDKNVGDTYFEEWSKKINEAFEVLKDPEVRAEYDLVYDDARAASKQTATVNKNDPCNTPPVETTHPLSMDATIQKLAPVYVSAKQAYIKSARNVEAIENRLKMKPMNAAIHFLSGGIMVLAILVWVALTNKNLFQAVSSPDPPVADRAAIIPLPALVKREATMAGNQTGFETVDLWLKVVTTKAYFFEQPEGAVLDDKFLSKGNKVHAIKKAGNYYYSVFQSAVNNSYKIEGWVKGADVEILAQ
ncbi:J domain-containing protein [Niabella sp. CJ426]|uniref:J domain-containing protein n=1 Tax=Niabella sp. CJ426 TaxID=3393740 RepID=UPI003CFC70A5